MQRRQLSLRRPLVGSQAFFFMPMCDLAKTQAAVEEMQHYCKEHPDSPVATRRPNLSVRGPTWVVLLGPSIREGIVGFGSTVTAALRAFDDQYLRSFRSGTSRKRPATA
jgi:hypothetical protein